MNVRRGADFAPPSPSRPRFTVKGRGRPCTFITLKAASKSEAWGTMSSSNALLCAGSYGYSADGRASVSSVRVKIVKRLQLRAGLLGYSLRRIQGWMSRMANMRVYNLW